MISKHNEIDDVIKAIFQTKVVFHPDIKKPIRKINMVMVQYLSLEKGKGAYSVSI